MKKLFLLGALICAGQLYGMEPIYEKTLWEELSHELQQIIISNALATSTNIDQVINVIKAFGALHGVYYDTQTATDFLMKMLPNDLDQAINKVKNLGTTLADFTKLVHILADKFNITTAEVASNFNTSVSEKYLMLGAQMIDVTENIYKPLMAQQLLQDGLDPNYSFEKKNYHESTLKSTLVDFACLNVMRSRLGDYETPAFVVLLLLLKGAKLSNDMISILNEQIKDYSRWLIPYHEKRIYEKEKGYLKTLQEIVMMAEFCSKIFK